MKRNILLFILLSSLLVNAETDKHYQLETALKKCNFYYKSGDLVKAKFEISKALDILGIEIASNINGSLKKDNYKAGYRAGLKKGKETYFSKGYDKGYKEALKNSKNAIVQEESSVSEIDSLDELPDINDIDNNKQEKKQKKPVSVISDINYGSVKANYRKFEDMTVKWSLTYQTEEELLDMPGYMRPGEIRITCYYGNSEWDKVILVVPQENIDKLSYYSAGDSFKIIGKVRGISEWGDPVIEFVDVAK